VTLEEWEEERDRELDENLTALFQAVERPEPSRRFAERTMKAVRRVPLPADRHPLRLPWTTPVGWAALVAGVAAAVWMVVVNQPLVAEIFASLVAGGIRTGISLVGTVHVGVAMFEVFSKIGGVMARVMSTREATAGLTLMIVIAACSLLTLDRLLFSEKESSSW
jgi:hypothetical protein